MPPHPSASRLPASQAALHHQVPRASQFLLAALPLLGNHLVPHQRVHLPVVVSNPRALHPVVHLLLLANLHPEVYHRLKAHLVEASSLPALLLVVRPRPLGSHLPEAHHQLKAHRLPLPLDHLPDALTAVMAVLTAALSVVLTEAITTVTTAKTTSTKRYTFVLNQYNLFSRMTYESRARIYHYH